MKKQPPKSVDEEDDRSHGELINKKQLNLNLPLLSVRRRLLSPPQCSRRHYQEEELDQDHKVTAATTRCRASAADHDHTILLSEGVPFSWEQAPGKPKLENINGKEDYLQQKQPPPATTGNWPWHHQHHKINVSYSQDPSEYHYHVDVKHDSRGNNIYSNDAVLNNCNNGEDTAVSINVVDVDERDHHRLRLSLSDDAVEEVTSLSEAIDILELRARTHHQEKEENKMVVVDLAQVLDEEGSCDRRRPISPSFMINRFLPDANALAEEYDHHLSSSSYYNSSSRSVVAAPSAPMSSTAATIKQGCGLDNIFSWRTKRRSLHQQLFPSTSTDPPSQ